MVLEWSLRNSASVFCLVHSKIYRLFHLFSCGEIFLKRTVSVDFRANRPNICRNCPFTENFLTKKSGGKAYILRGVYCHVSFGYYNSSRKKFLKFPRKNCVGIHAKIKLQALDLQLYQKKDGFKNGFNFNNSTEQPWTTAST